MPLLTTPKPRKTRAALRASTLVQLSQTASPPPSLLSVLSPPPPLLTSLAILTFESLFCLVIVAKVTYTEIDWVAYMSEVEGYLSGEFDYTKLSGGTGPLVYPAGFLYTYQFLRSITENGTAIKTAQYCFAGVYIANTAIMLKIYNIIYPNTSTTNTWKFTISSLLLCCSKRIHSIYVLRCFNDTISTLLLNLAVLLFLSPGLSLPRRNHVASFVYSLSVSIKMNTLLYSPAILLYYLHSTTPLHTFLSLLICATTQLVLGYPFLSTYPLQYLRKAFELDRVFTYKWTVNLKFLPESTFTSKPWSLLVFLLHVGSLAVLVRKYLSPTHLLNKRCNRVLNPLYTALLLFSCNFLGIAFSRTLHYQFYCWYFDSLPLLIMEGWEKRCGGLWRGVGFTVGVMGMIEYAFNVFPATGGSSAVLQIAHGVVLVGVMTREVPRVFLKVKDY